MILPLISLLLGLEFDLIPQPDTNDNTRAVIYRSLDYGQTWLPLTTNLPPETEVSFLERRGSQIVLATDNLGIFLSDDQKQRWKQIGSGLPAKKITALHLSGNQIYSGVHQHGIYVTTNDGETWQSLNADLKDLRVRAIQKIGEELLVATDVGIFKSSSGQNKWTQTFSACQVISLNAAEDKIIAGGVLGVLISRDRGNSWAWIHQAGAAHNTAILDGEIFIMNISGDLFVSGDWGRTWSKSAYSPREGSYVYEVANAGPNFVMSNNYGIHRSTDAGKSWQLAYPREDLVLFDFLVFDQTIYAGTRSWNEYRKRRKS